MTLNSFQLEAFGALAKTKNFTVAAKKIGITQSALSQRIANLESELKTTLLIRNKTGIVLTDAGVQLMKYCQAHEQLESELVARLHSQDKRESPAGILRLGGYSSIMRSIVLPRVAPLLRKHPAIQAHFFSRELDALPALLKSGEVDYLILDRKLNAEGIASIQIATEEYALVESRDYSGGETYLDHDPEDETTARFLRLMGASVKKQKYERMFLDDIYGVLDGTREGLGRAVVPKHLLTKEILKELKILSPQASMKNPVVLHFHEQPFYSKLHEAVLACLAG